MFSFKLNYNTKEIGSANALQYNGNISETIWRTANDVSTNKTRAYAYQYDALSRITGADYGIKTTTSFNLASGFDMGIGLYDKNGNIKSLWRDNMANTKIDQLSYTYANGNASNKLLKVEDSSGSTEGFKNGDTQATEYTYDGNGNMLRDYNKGITTNITYNYLNLPTLIQFAVDKKIEYFYDAVGTKQKKIVTNGATTTMTDYAGNYIYQNNALQFINQPEGYIEPSTGQTAFDYAYQLKDHLGNIRLTFVDYDHNGSIVSSEITEENNYYPFGLKHQGYNSVISSNTNAIGGKIKYNGKELNDELGLDLYDYGARFYGPDGSRFFTIDPKAEQFPWQSPYAYAANNPIKFIDKNGENPAIPIAVGVAAVDALLIATGIVATGIILHKAADGSFAINSNITDFFYKDNPGYREQQKREGASQRETSQIKQNHAKSVDNNVGKPTPDGGSSPKGGGSTVAKVVAGAGFAAEFVRSCDETTGGNNQNSSSEKQSNGNTVTTISQGATTSESTSNIVTNSTFTMPVYTIPSDNTRVVTPIIPLKIDEKN